jgi:hypothetical protein
MHDHAVDHASVPEVLGYEELPVDELITLRSRVDG